MDAVPFPVAMMPDQLAEFVTETAAALGCSQAYVALPVLASVAGAIGNSRTVQIKPGWTEPAVVWAAVVARSGTLKSPAFDAATKPHQVVQHAAARDHSEAMQKFDEAQLQHEKDLQQWKKKKGSGPAPKKPEVPLLPRNLVNDTTVEGLAAVLYENPRGVVLVRDELSGWFRSFNQYKSGRGSDGANWLEFFRAGQIVIDRKTGNPRMIIVPRAAVSICGTIQPGVLASVLTTDVFESGLAARLLLAQPPEMPKKWSNRYVSQSVCSQYEAVLKQLFSLELREGELGREPIALPISQNAIGKWEAWYNKHARRILEAESDPVNAALAKIEAYAARFALLFALVGDPDSVEVSRDAVERGTKLADWFAGEIQRVYGLISGMEEHRTHMKLVEWIRARGGAVTPRDLQRLRSGEFRYVEQADAALQALVKAEIGAFVSEQHGRGRPSTVFRLNASPAADKNKEIQATDVNFVSQVGEADTRPLEERFLDVPEANGGCHGSFEECAVNLEFDGNMPC